MGLSDTHSLQQDETGTPPVAWHLNRQILALSDGAHHVLVYHVGVTVASTTVQDHATPQPDMSLAHACQQQVVPRLNVMQALDM